MARYHVRTAYEGFKVQFPKRKIPPCKTGEKFCRVKRRQNKSGVLRGGKNLHGEQTHTVQSFAKAAFAQQ